MNDLWTQNREGLGINILASVIYAAVVGAVWWIGKRTPSGPWRVVYVIDAGVMASVTFVYAFSPTAKFPQPAWTLMPWLGGLSFCVFLLFVGSVVIRPRSEPVLPPTEEELNPLSSEAKTLLKAAITDPHLTFLGTMCMGQKGTQYNTNIGLVMCEGDDAIQSAKFDAAIKQLSELDYLTETPSGEVFTLTAKGVERAQKL